MVGLDCIHFRDVCFLHHFAAGSVKINFSSNVLHCARGREVTDYLIRHFPDLRHYPSPAPVAAEAALASGLGIDGSELCLTNGATEAIYLIAQTFRGRRSGVIVPSFSEYTDACRLHGHRVTALYNLSNVGDYDLIWICNPNNPTGGVMPFDDLFRIVERNANTLFIIDQSYEHFTEKRLFTVADAVALPNVILLHSFTKVLALPGLRLGYLTACSLLTDTIRRQRMPWPVGTIGLAAVDYIARNPELLVFDLGALLNERQRVEQKLSALPAIDVWPSDSHILLARLRYGSVASLKAYLMKQHGLLIRDATNFEGLGNGCFRITVRSASENDCLIAAIKRWLSI